jgi:soluble lytic murein transglycosylase-like protein
MYGHKRDAVHLAHAILLVGFGLAGEASAGVLRCETAEGVIRYSTEPVPGATCKPIDSTPGAAIAAPAIEAPAGAVRGEIFAFDVAGVRRFATALPPGVDVQNVRRIRYTFIEKCFACGASDAEFGRSRLNRSAYAAEIRAASAETGVEEALIRAIAHAESAFIPDALSRAGAQGVMQLMPGTAQRFGVRDAFNPEQNIRGGAQYLALLIRRYPGNLELAVAAYNAGEGAVDRYGGVPPYSETRRYVARVAELLRQYRAAP